jgi:hypothetical protein
MFGAFDYERLAGRYERLAGQVESVAEQVEKLSDVIETKTKALDFTIVFLRTELSLLYMEMAEVRKRTSRLEEYTRVLDKHAADEPVHYTGGAFGHLSLLEQHRMQQRGSEY